MNDYIALLTGIACAGFGGELFVRGTVGLGQWLRISPGIVGATFAAFATSSPEFAVSLTAALAGSPQIALGDALGSNVVNIALILALVLVGAGIRCPRDSIRRDFPVALFVPVFTGFLLWDGSLSRIDGFLLLSLFVAWLAATVIEVRRQRSAAEAVLGEHRRGLIVVSCLVGLTLLVVAGHLIVEGGQGIARAFGLDEFIVGAALVAVGTSVPEMATAIIARWRGHDEVGLGTLLGSNIFNGLFIVAVAAVIRPIAIDWNEAAVALVAGLVALAMVFPPRSGVIGRMRGMLLLGLYVAYLIALFR